MFPAKYAGDEMFRSCGAWAPSDNARDFPADCCGLVAASSKLWGRARSLRRFTVALMPAGYLLNLAEQTVARP